MSIATEELLESSNQLDPTTRGYLEAVLWSSSDESDEAGGEPFDLNYGISDIAPESLELAKRECAEFRERAKDILVRYPKDAEVGHDFWLTRVGHGAGFWDGDYEVEEGDGDALTEIAEQFKERWAYLGDDGKIYIE